MRRRRVLAVWLLAAAIACGGCGRCGRERALAPERHLPPDATAVVVPELDEALEQAGAVLGSLAKFPAAAGLPSWRAALQAQLGFDPLQPDGLESAGVDPDGGAALARTAQGWILVLPVDDAGRLDATVARLARDRLGASHRAEQPQGGVRVVLFSRAAGQPPELAYALASGLAFLARGPNAPQLAGHVASLPAAQALEASPGWKRARDLLGRGHAAILYTPAAGPLAPRWPPLRDGAAAGLSGEEERLAVRGALLLTPEREQAWREALGTEARGSADDLARLPADGFVVGRFAGDPVPLARRLLWMAPELAQALAGAGLDVERELLPALAPGAAAAISLAPTFDVSAFSRGARAAASRDPFRLVHVAAIARATSPEAFQAAMAALARAAPKAGVTVAQPAAGEPAWTVSRGEATLEIALAGDRVLVAGGAGRMEALRGLSKAKGWSAPTSGAKKLAGHGAGAVVLDLRNLVASAQALPPSAYGSGPDAFVMRSIADRVLEPASRLEAAAANVELVGGAARLELVVEARPGAEPRP